MVDIAHEQGNKTTMEHSSLVANFQRLCLKIQKGETSTTASSERLHDSFFRRTR